MMKLSIIYSKVKKKLWYKLVSFTRGSTIYPFIYLTYWHSLINKKEKRSNESMYFAARPNSGAGIGHQLANWIAGYWYAKQFGLKFAHIPFSTEKWETFLGFYNGEQKVVDLLKLGYKTRKLPLFIEDNKLEIERTLAIIGSYVGKKIIFIAEQDQYYKDQFGVMSDIKCKFNAAKSRLNEQTIYDPTHFNIAVHVRRTVVIGDKIILENNTARAKRWLSNDYYEKVLKQVLDNINVSKPISIYIFSTGKAEEFGEFSKYGNVYFCSDMDEYASFLHLVRADLLITSKSSFSYKPALMNDAIKVCPRNFWHGYPNSKDWILVENDGIFDTNCLKNI